MPGLIAAQSLVIIDAGAERDEGAAGDRGGRSRAPTLRSSGQAKRAGLHRPDAASDCLGSFSRLGGFLFQKSPRAMTAPWATKVGWPLFCFDLDWRAMILGRADNS